MIKDSFNQLRYVDRVLLGLVITLSTIGIVMMSSASIDYSAQKYNNPMFHAYRQLIFLVLAVIAGFAAFMVPSKKWYEYGGICLLAGFLLLVAVLIPGIGREVNGSMRWIPLGPINLQSSEPAKLFVLIYLAGYLVRRQDEVRERWRGFIKPILVLVVLIVLLLMEPDFGSSVVMLTACMGMIFLAGVGVKQFMVLVLSSLIAVALMATSSSYRMQRLKCFVDPWEHPYDCGYQLTQSLIAFGRGEWMGLGLGNSIQKQFYLPEAHTDFVFAIIAEETGFIGGFLTLLVFAALITKILMIAKKSEAVNDLFSAYLAYGIALIIATQVFINMGVNTGLLPTKGLTLPFLSYGGSSLIVCFIMMGMLARIDADISSQDAASEEQNARGLRSAI
ncbi:MAG: putative lipid II flippase FtsW [Pseudomonadales bacterium]|nr:putative lipid II flippase FtsW [Pseudomonadales bacterium]